MANAAYGNHDAPPPGERADPKAASAKPGSGSTDRPGLDLGGAGDLAAAEGASGGSHANPDPSGTGPHSGLKDSTSPTMSDRRDRSTPGSGALPNGPQGAETDPATD